MCCWVLEPLVYNSATLYRVKSPYSPIFRAVETTEVSSTFEQNQNIGPVVQKLISANLGLNVFKTYVLVSNLKEICKFLINKFFPLKNQTVIQKKMFTYS